MSDDEPLAEPEPEADVDQEESDDEEKPDVPEEATAEIDLDAIDDDLEEADDQEASEDAEPEPADDAGAALVPGGNTIGDMYVKGLVATSNAVIEKHDGEPISDQMARDVGLDDAMNQFIRERGGVEDLPPGQAVLIGTTMFAMAVLASNPQIVTSAMGVFE
ncbi:hypothetical protein OB905_11815 [Halobacteria archaeon AArc-dxtr1]|nr:hypothetical protein [Halobacteria archaeon AArc-dxtr1]